MDVQELRTKVDAGIKAVLDALAEADWERISQEDNADWLVRGFKDHCDRVLGRQKKFASGIRA